MKVILLLDVDKLGKKDQVIEVNDGYAKNYLIKNKLAVQVSKGTLDSLNNRKEVEHQNDLELRNQAIDIKNKIESKKYVYELKCHENKVFGHITLKEILIDVNKEFPTINKFMFIDKKHEWSLGKHQIKIKLYKDVIAFINIEVLSKEC